VSNDRNLITAIRNGEFDQQYAEEKGTRRRESASGRQEKAPKMILC
jgi:hypothetical protein